MSCNTCVNYGIYEMITSGKPYGYGGDIPCNRCSRHRTFEDLYREICSHFSKPVIKYPEKFLTYEHRERNGVKEIDSRYNAGFNDAIDTMRKLNGEGI